LCWPSPPVGTPPPRCLAFLSASRTSPLTIGPRYRPAPPVSRALPRRPCPAALPCSHNSAAARAQRPGAVAGHVLHPTLLTAMPEAISLSVVSFPPCGTEPTPPPISLPCSSLCAHRFGKDTGASLCSVPRPSLSSSSPPSPPPMHPPCRLPPPKTPPPLWFPPEDRRHQPLLVSMTACSLSVQMDSPLTFSLPLRHCRAAPSMSSITGTPSLAMNAAARSILHCPHTTPMLG
jgi:hypothetical protein